MDAMTADLVTRWTVRIAMAAYLVRATWDLATPTNRAFPARADRMAKTVRLIWTIGGLFYLAHVFVAFGAIHGWSHARAWEHVSTRTEELTGVASGAGLILNHLATVIWLVDIICWWRDPNWWKRPISRWLLHPYFGFLVVQATVVFGPPPWRIVAVVWGIIAVGVGWQSRRARDKADSFV